MKVGDIVHVHNDNDEHVYGIVVTEEKGGNYGVAVLVPTLFVSAGDKHGQVGKKKEKEADKTGDEIDAAKTHADVNKIANARGVQVEGTVEEKKAALRAAEKS